MWIGKKGLRYWYYRYRDSEYYVMGMIAVTIVVCLLLIFYVIMPQLNNWFSIRKQVIAARGRIATLQSNITFLNSLDRATLDQQLQTASTALPPEKDFSTMLNAISDAANASGISLNDFAFQVGNIASSSGQAADIRYRDIATIKITLVANGSIDQIHTFIATLSKRTPLSEVTNLDGTGKNVSISVQFYQKPLPKIDVSGNTQLQPISAQKLALLQELSKWKSSPAVQQLFPQSASSSGVPLF